MTSSASPLTVRLRISRGLAMSWMWSARLYNALIAALSRYSTAVRSTVSRGPPEAASVVAMMSAWLKLSMLLRSISPLR